MKVFKHNKVYEYCLFKYKITFFKYRNKTDSVAQPYGVYFGFNKGINSKNSHTGFCAKITITLKGLNRWYCLSIRKLKPKLSLVQNFT